MDFTHPRIIPEKEFYNFMVNKFELNNDHPIIYTKYIDMMYVLLDKQDSPKWCVHHHLNLANLNKFESMINTITKHNSILDTFGEIIFNMLTNEDILTYEIYNRLNCCGFKASYCDIAKPYEKISKEQFINKLKVYIHFWVIY